MRCTGVSFVHYFIISPSSGILGGKKTLNPDPECGFLPKVNQNFVGRGDSKSKPVIFDPLYLICARPQGEGLCLPEDHWFDANAVLEDGHRRNVQR